MANDDLRSRKAQLEVEEQIAEAIKRYTASLENFAEAQKKIAENYKLMKKISQEMEIIQQEITELEAQGTEESKEKAKKLKEELDSLKQQQQVLIGINKELAKGKNLTKVVRNELINWGKNLKSKFIPSLSEVFNTFLKLNDLAIQTSVNIGLSGEGMALMKNNIQGSQMAWAELGFDLESSGKIQQALADETGRQVVLSQQVQEQAALTARALNMQGDELGQLIGQMDQFGLGSELAMSSIMDMRIESEKMGVNSGKVIKKFQQNMELMNKLNFQSGIKGLQKMAALSEKYKIEMSAVASAADKAFKPEGAIEMAAQLQVLGGSLAELGDPFKLMYEARNNPEKFMEDITKAAKASAEWDPKTKEFKVSAYEMDRLRVAAEATGMSMEDLVKTAKQGAKLDMFESMLSGRNLNPEQKDMLTGLMEVGKNGEIMINGTDIKNLDDNALKKITQRESELQALADQAMSSEKELTAIKNMIMVGVVKFFTENEALIKEFLSGVKSVVSFLLQIFSPTGLLATGLGVYFGSKVLWPMIQGRIFGSSAAAAFNAGTAGGGGKGGFFSKLNPMNWRKKGDGAMTPQSTAAPTTTPTPGQQGPGGITKGINMTDMIKGAAAILILSAALFVFAKSLQEFDKLQNGWETLGMAAVGLLTLTGALFLVSKIPTEGVLKGALAIVALGVAMIPLAYAMSLMQGVDWAVLAVATGAIIGFAFAGMFLGEMLAGPQFLFFLVGLGALILAAGALSIAMWLLSYGLEAVAPPMEMFMNSISALPQLILPLMMLGPALRMAALGIFALSASLHALGMAWWFGGGAFTEMTETIGTALQGIDPSGLNASIEAINSVDMEKLNALKELSLWMSLLGSTTTIKFDESLSIDGSIEISGEGGGKSNTDWIKDPIFVSKLKELIATQTQKDLNGGKA